MLREELKVSEEARIKAEGERDEQTRLREEESGGFATYKGIVKKHGPVDRIVGERDRLRDQNRSLQEENSRLGKELKKAIDLARNLRIALDRKKGNKKGLFGIFG